MLTLFRSLGFCLLACALFLSGCASLTHRSRYQYILVRTQPEGAEIYFHNKLIGTSPAYVEVRRAKSAELTLKTSRETKTIQLDSKYRWKGSFWTNFALLPLAPVGWTVDLISGGAWNMVDPVATPIMNTPAASVRKNKVVAIAPPEARTVKQSDEAGLYWNQQLKKQYTGSKIVPYEDTLKEFVSHGYDYNRKPNLEGRHELYGRLGADLIFESEIKDDGKNVELRGRFRDAYNNSPGPDHVEDLGPNQNGTGESTSWFQDLSSWFHFFPNTIGLEWARNYLALQNVDSSTHTSHTPDNASFSGELFSFLSAIDLRYLNPPRRNSSSHFAFSLTPATRLSTRQLQFPDSPGIGQTTFNYTLVEAGYGPEMGWQIGPHYLYVDIIPMLGWHHLSWNDQSLSSVDLLFKAEMGYLYFLTQNISARLFLKVTTEPTGLWNNAAQTIAPGSSPIMDAYDYSVGLTFSYTFEFERSMQSLKPLGRAPAF